MVWNERPGKARGGGAEKDRAQPRQEVVAIGIVPKNLFPPRSPDLNPTENLFSRIDDIMEQYELPARNIDELKARTVKAVEEINRSKLPERLIRSMSTRIKWVADNKGRFYAQRT